MSRNPKPMIHKMVGYIKLQLARSPAADANHLGQLIEFPTAQRAVWSMDYGKCNSGFPQVE